MRLYTKILKNEIQSENGVEHTQTNGSQIVMERSSCAVAE